MSSALVPPRECHSAQPSTEHGVPDKSVDVCSTTKIKDSKSQNPKMSRSVIGDIYIENGGKVTLQLKLPAYELEALRRNFEEGAEDQERVEDLKKRNEELPREIEEGAEHQNTTEDLHTRNEELRTKVEGDLKYQKRIEDLEKRNEELRRVLVEEAEYQKATEDLHTQNEELRRKVKGGLEYKRKAEELEKRNEELQRKIKEGAEYQKATEDLHMRNEELERKFEDVMEHQERIKDLEKPNEELRTNIEEGEEYRKISDDLQKRNEELQRSNRELQSRVVDLEAKLVDCDTGDKKAEAEICAYKTKTAYLEWDVQGLRNSIFSLRPFEQVSDKEIEHRFNSICQSIYIWVRKQLPRNSSEPIFLDGDNQHFAYILRDDNRAGAFIIQSLIHQCLQKEFFGEHVYLVGLPEEHVALVQFIQKSMATKKPFPAQPRGVRVIDNWRSETLKALATLPEVVKWRDEFAHAAAERIFRFIQPFFPVAAKHPQSSGELYEEIIKPSVQLALAIKTASRPYFMPPMNDLKQLYGFERVGIDIVGSITAIDFKSQKELKPTSSIRKDTEGFIGKPILLVEPALLLKEYGDNDVVWPRPLRHATYLLELFYPLEENELDRQNDKVQEFSKPPPWLVKLVTGSYKEVSTEEMRDLLQHGNPERKLGSRGGTLLERRLRREALVNSQLTS